jgi:hypothetical protein
MNLKSAENAITGATLAGLVVAVLTLIWTITAMLFSGSGSRSWALAPLTHVVVLLALSYCVWRKNKVCAILLTVYFVSLLAWKTASWVQSKAVPLGILSDFIALLLCLNGVRGLFAYHKLKQNEQYVEQQ